MGDVAGELADALVRLRPEEAILLEAGDAFVQFIRFKDGIVLKGPAVYVHTTAGEPGSAVAAELAALGWAPQDDDQTAGQPEVRPPLDLGTGRRLADLIVRTSGSYGSVGGGCGPRPRVLVHQRA